MTKFGKPLSLRQMGLALGIWLISATSAVADPMFGVNYVHIDPRSNIFSAGSPTAKATTFGGAGILPVLVPIGSPPPSLPGQPSPSVERVFTLPNAIGQVSADGIKFNGLDGGQFFGGQTQLTGIDGVSGINHANRTMFLSGVFLDDKSPAATTAPQSLTFDANADFNRLTPKIGQVFFIGDGLSNAGKLQQFIVPETATRLYLGIADGFNFSGGPGFYDDNQGGIDLNYKLQTFAVPEPATLAAWSIAVLGATVWGIRRRQHMRLA